MHYCIYILKTFIFKNLVSYFFFTNNCIWLHFDKSFFLSQSNPVQGSKLRLPGYLSGKGFQSGEEGSLISAAVLKARTQTIGGE